MADIQQSASNLGLDLDQDANEAPSDEEVGTVLARIKAARASATDPVDLQQFQSAQDQAAQLYKEQANRSEWLSVADKIGAAVTKFAAAKAGQKAGVDLSHIDTGPGYDLNGALDRAGKDYSTELGRIRGNREDALKNQSQDYTLADKAFDSAARTKNQKAISDREDKREQARKAESDANRLDADRRQERGFQQQLGLQSNRISQEQSAIDQRERVKREEDAAKEERFNKAKELKDLDLEEKNANQQYVARQQLFNNLMNDGDLGGKTRDKLQADYGKQAAVAGVDLSDIQQRLEDQETTRPGWMGGRTKEEERTAKQAILSDSLKETKNLLDAIKAKKEARLRSSKPVVHDPSQTAPDQDGVAPKRTVTAADLTAYAKAHNMDEKAAADWLTKQGFQVVQ
jgi:hypothetical protein